MSWFLACNLRRHVGYSWTWALEAHRRCRNIHFLTDVTDRHTLLRASAVYSTLGALLAWGPEGEGYSVWVMD